MFFCARTEEQDQWEIWVVRMCPIHWSVRGTSITPRTTIKHTKSDEVFKMNANFTFFGEIFCCGNRWLLVLTNRPIVCFVSSWRFWAVSTACFLLAARVERSREKIHKYLKFLKRRDWLTGGRSCEIHFGREPLEVCWAPWTDWKPSAHSVRHRTFQLLQRVMAAIFYLTLVPKTNWKASKTVSNQNSILRIFSATPRPFITVTVSSLKWISPESSKCLAWIIRPGANTIIPSLN